MELAGADDCDGRTDAERQHNGKDEVGILPEETPQKLNESAGEGCEDESAQHGILLKNQADRNAGQGRVGQRVPNHGITPEDKENADARA